MAEAFRAVVRQVPEFMLTKFSKLTPSLFTSFKHYNACLTVCWEKFSHFAILIIKMGNMITFYAILTT